MKRVTLICDGCEKPIAAGQYPESPYVVCSDRDYEACSIECATLVVDRIVGAYLDKIRRTPETTGIRVDFRIEIYRRERPSS
jgi:hypothetical protein